MGRLFWQFWGGLFVLMLVVWKKHDDGAEKNAMLNSKLNNHFQMLVNRMLYKLLRTCTKFLLSNKNKLFLICISNLFIVACIPAQGVNDAQSISMSDRQQIPATTKAAHTFQNGTGNFCALAPFPNLIPECPTGLCPWCLIKVCVWRAPLLRKKITTSTNTTRKLFWGERQHPSIRSLRSYLSCK